MTREKTFGQQLQPHVGELVRVRIYGGGVGGLSGKIGLLMSVSEAWSARSSPTAQIEVFIDGNVRTLYVYPRELELLGADDAK